MESKNMDGFAENVVLAYRADTKKKKQNNKCSCFQKKKEAKRDDQSLRAIGKDTRDDVCCCIRVLSEYIKETIKLVCCTPVEPKNCEPKFGPMFCELGDVTIRLVRDVYNFLKYLLKAIICSIAAKGSSW